MKAELSGRFPAATQQLRPHPLLCLCPQVREGSCHPGGEQGGPGEREGGVVQRGPGPGRGVGLPVHGDLCQEQNHGGRTLRRDRSPDGLRCSARQGRALLLLLQYTIATRASIKEGATEETHTRTHAHAHANNTEEKVMADCGGF